MITTPQGLIIPYPTECLKLLGSRIGTPAFALAQFSNIGAKEHDLTLLKSFPYWYQHTKLLTFSINTLLNYFHCTTPPQCPPPPPSNLMPAKTHSGHTSSIFPQTLQPLHTTPNMNKPSIRLDWVFVKAAWAATKFTPHSCSILFFCGRHYSMAHFSPHQPPMAPYTPFHHPQGFAFTFRPAATTMEHSHCHHMSNIRH